MQQQQQQQQQQQYTLTSTSHKSLFSNIYILEALSLTNTKPRGEKYGIKEY